MTGRWRAPSLLYCTAVLFAVKVGLRLRGYAWTLRWMRRSATAGLQAPTLPDLAVPVVENRLALAAALYPGRAACLEQSLALYFLLRKVGVPVEFRLGVQARPFLAHAWIECAGKPVNDVLEHVQWFTPLTVPAP